MAERYGYRVHEGRAHATAARSNLRLRQFEETTEQAGMALAIYQETGHRLGEARARDMLGQAALHLQDGAALAGRLADRAAAALGHWRAGGHRAPAAAERAGH
jgi:hypothetical protein